MAMLTAMAVPFSAFAEETKSITTNGGSDTTEVSYDVQAKYTVTIPAGVELSNTEKKSKSITASDVMLESGQNIVVKLTSASNTESGSTFNAKNGDSVAIYTINSGEVEVAVGDTIAEFTTDGSQNLTFSTASGETYAGKHTETLTFSISVEEAAPANPYLTASVGDVVAFGGYDWYVIDKRDDGVTLLMQNTLMNKAYNEDYADITWEDCTLRTYLNSDFYNSFNDEDKAKIAKTNNTNPDNPDYNTNGGNDTEDCIYLLSIDEANALDSNIRNCGASWWLRSPGAYDSCAALVYRDGSLSTYGDGIYGRSGVRPALNLEF